VDELIEYMKKGGLTWAKVLDPTEGPASSADEADEGFTGRYL
jgi:hypothetical protein